MIGGANGGANGGVAGRCWLALDPPDSLKEQRPAPSDASRVCLRIKSPDFSRSAVRVTGAAELAHKSSDGADARDGFVTVSESDFGVFRPFPRERPSAKSLSLGETRLTGGVVALGSWRFESSRPS